MGIQNLPFFIHKSPLIFFALAVLVGWEKPVWAVEVEVADQVQTLEVRIEEALAEQRPRDRLNRPAEICQAILLEEIPDALALSKERKQLRDPTVLREVALKRWSELQSAAAFEYIAGVWAPFDRGGPGNWPKSGSIKRISLMISKSTGFRSRSIPCEGRGIFELRKDLL